MISYIKYNRRLGIVEILYYRIVKCIVVRCISSPSHRVEIKYIYIKFNVLVKLIKLKILRIVMLNIINISSISFFKYTNNNYLNNICSKTFITFFVILLFFCFNTHYSWSLDISVHNTNILFFIIASVITAINLVIKLPNVV